MKGKAWLGYSIGQDGRAKQVHSLGYSLDGDKRLAHYIELGGFRPSPETEMVVDKKYDAVLYFSEEYSYDGKDVKVLRRVEMGKMVFVHIR